VLTGLGAAIADLARVTAGSAAANLQGYLAFPRRDRRLEQTATKPVDAVMGIDLICADALQPGRSELTLPRAPWPRRDLKRELPGGSHFVKQAENSRTFLSSS
jgi:hypothetical protein